MAAHPTLQLHPFYPAHQVPPPSVYPFGVYLGPFMDGWETGHFVVCPHTCSHTNSHQDIFQNVFIWPANLRDRSYDHVNNRSFHQDCKAGCPAFGKFDSGGVVNRRPASLAETVRGIIQWSIIAQDHRDVLLRRELAWVKRIEAGEDLQNHQLRALWDAAPRLPALIPSPYSNFGIGPDAGRLQFQDLPTHLSQAMRPFDVSAAIVGLPAMPGSSVPGPGPVICGYNGLGAPSPGNTSTFSPPSHQMSNDRIPIVSENAAVHRIRNESSESAVFSPSHSVKPTPPELPIVFGNLHPPSPCFPSPETFENALAGPSTSKLFYPPEKQTSIKLEPFEDIAEFTIKTEASFQKEDFMDTSEAGPGREEKLSTDQLIDQKENNPRNSRLIELEKALQSREADNRTLLAIVRSLTELLHLREKELELHKSMIKDLTEDLFTPQLKALDTNTTTTAQPTDIEPGKDSSDSSDDDSLFNE
ncbi:hypothetical protein FB446DRAFT_712536 [Lentinula raphanica]|nr:hypothetical protein FB446DRAFT_712536 [Lentinula raphanica]